MWIGNVYNFILPQIIKWNIIWGLCFPRNNLKINVFQNIKFKKFVKDSSYYLCVFVFYVYILEVQVWKQELRWHCDYVKG